MLSTQVRGTNRYIGARIVPTSFVFDAALF
jgi:hypothetical protein